MKTLYDEKRIKKILTECQGALKHKAFTPPPGGNRRYGRDRDVELSPGIDPFDIDCWKIENSDGFARKFSVTQVFPHSRDRHTNTRGRHMINVGARGEFMARVLSVNDKLVRAGGILHDMGHMPYGHIGEYTLARLATEILGFECKMHHNQHSVFIAQHIENNCRGMDLCLETLLGAYYHSSNKGPVTRQEGVLDEHRLIKYADKLYVFPDYDDARRHPDWGPKFRHKAIEALGKNCMERTYTVMAAIIEESARKGEVSFTEGDVHDLFEEGRRYMWDNVYNALDFDFHVRNIETVYAKVRDLYEEAPYVDPIVLVSLMTDNDIKELADSKIRMDSIEDTLPKTSVGRIIPTLYNREFEYWKLDLDWGTPQGPDGDEYKKAA